MLRPSLEHWNWNKTDIDVYGNATNDVYNNTMDKIFGNMRSENFFDYDWSLNKHKFDNITRKRVNDAKRWLRASWKKDTETGIAENLIYDKNSDKNKVFLKEEKKKRYRKVKRYVDWANLLMDNNNLKNDIMHAEQVMAKLRLLEWLAKEEEKFKKENKKGSGLYTIDELESAGVLADILLITEYDNIHYNAFGELTISEILKQIDQLKKYNKLPVDTTTIMNYIRFAEYKKIADAKLDNRTFTNLFLNNNKINYLINNQDDWSKFIRNTMINLLNVEDEIDQRILLEQSKLRPHVFIYLLLPYRTTTNDNWLPLILNVYKDYLPSFKMKYRAKEMSIMKELSDFLNAVNAAARIKELSELMLKEIDKLFDVINEETLTKYLPYPKAPVSEEVDLREELIPHKKMYINLMYKLIRFYYISEKSGKLNLEESDFLQSMKLKKYEYERLKVIFADLQKEYLDDIKYNTLLKKENMKVVEKIEANPKLSAILALKTINEELPLSKQYTPPDKLQIFAINNYETKDNNWDTLEKIAGITKSHIRALKGEIILDVYAIIKAAADKYPTPDKIDKTKYVDGNKVNTSRETSYLVESVINTSISSSLRQFRDDLINTTRELISSATDVKVGRHMTINDWGKRYLYNVVKGQLPDGLKPFLDSGINIYKDSFVTKNALAKLDQAERSLDSNYYSTYINLPELDLSAINSNGNAPKSKPSLLTLGDNEFTSAEIPLHAFDKNGTLTNGKKALFSKYSSISLDKDSLIRFKKDKRLYVDKLQSNGQKSAYYRLYKRRKAEINRQRNLILDHQNKRALEHILGTKIANVDYFNQLGGKNGGAMIRQGLTSGFSALWNRLTNNNPAITESIENFKSGYNQFKGHWDKAFTTGINFVSDVQRSVTDVANTINDTIDSAVNIIDKAGKTIAPVASAAANFAGAVGTLFGKPNNSLVGGLNNLSSMLGNLFGGGGASNPITMSQGLIRSNVTGITIGGIEVIGYVLNDYYEELDFLDAPVAKRTLKIKVPIEVRDQFKDYPNEGSLCHIKRSYAFNQLDIDLVRAKGPNQPWPLDQWKRMDEVIHTYVAKLSKTSNSKDKKNKKKMEDKEVLARKGDVIEYVNMEFEIVPVIASKASKQVVYNKARVSYTEQEVGANGSSLGGLESLLGGNPGKVLGGLSGAINNDGIINKIASQALGGKVGADIPTLVKFNTQHIQNLNKNKPSGFNFGNIMNVIGAGKQLVGAGMAAWQGLKGLKQDFQNMFNRIKGTADTIHNRFKPYFAGRKQKDPHEKNKKHKYIIDDNYFYEKSLNRVDSSKWYSDNVIISTKNGVLVKTIYIGNKPLDVKGRDITNSNAVTSVAYSKY